MNSEYRCDNRQNRLAPRHLGAVVLLALALGGLAFRVRLVCSGDNTEYLALAKSIVGGQGYRMIAEPGAPIETKRPPG